MALTYPSASAWLWNNDQLSDVQVDVVIKKLLSESSEPSECASSESGQVINGAKDSAVVTDTATEDAADGFTQSYLLHTAILACGSEYFKTRLCGGEGLQYVDETVATPEAACSGKRGRGRGRRGRGRAGSSSSTGASATAPRKLLIVTVENLDEMDAVKVVLQHMYFGDLGESIQSAATLALVLATADRLQAVPCMTSCVNVLVKPDGVSLDVHTINVLLDDIPGLLLCSNVEALWRALDLRLLHLFGDADAVCSDCDVSITALRLLSHTALLRLLSSSNLKARSENSVLALLHEWRLGDIGASCTSQQAQQLLQQLRLGALSFTFMHEVLPSMSWLSIATRERFELLRYHASEAGRRKFSKMPRGFSGWYLNPRAPGPAGSSSVSIDWCLPRADLEAILQRQTAMSLEVVCSAPKFFNGFMCSAALVLGLLRDTHHRATWLGVHVQLPALKKCSSTGVDVAATLYLKTGQRGRAAGAASVQPFASEVAGVLFAFALHTPLETAFVGKDQLSINTWEPLLQDGTLQVRAVLSSCG